MIVSANMSLIEWVNINCIYFISAITLEIILPYMFLQSVSKVTAKEREGKRREGVGREVKERKRVASSVWKTLWLKGIQGFPVLIWAYKTSRKATSLDRGFPCSRTRDFQVSKGLTRRLEVPDGKAESTGAESGEELQK